MIQAIRQALGKWWPPTAAGRVIAVIGYLLAALLGYVTPGFFTPTTYQCGSQVTTYPSYPGQGLAYIVLILATLILVRGLSRFTHWSYKLIVLFSFLWFFASAFVIALSHSFDGFCF